MKFTYSNDSNIEVVPESSEITDSVNVDFNDLFHNIVEDEENEEDLAEVHKSVKS